MAALGTSLPSEQQGPLSTLQAEHQGATPTPRLTADEACPLTEQLTVMWATQQWEVTSRTTGPGAWAVLGPPGPGGGRGTTV